MYNSICIRIYYFKIKKSNLFKTRVKHHIVFIVFHINIVKTTHYLYETVYYGYYQNYTTYNTVCGIYYIQAEYYINGSSETIYTGAIRYVLSSSFATYSHIDTIQFDYQSYYFSVDDISAPEAIIYLINDYWGQEKMIISSEEIGTPFKITQSEHYNRNQYNKINGYDVDLLFDTEDDIISDGSWTLLSDDSSYFHQLLSENSTNKKYVKDIEYVNINTNKTVSGSLELVYAYNSQTDEWEVEYEDLVTFTFNFCSFENYDENENFLLFFSAVPDGHYIMDVYPYLIWGNSETDYDNHTAYERFVWDKDSVAGPHPSYSPIGKNLSGDNLTYEYDITNIGDYGGTSIPIAIRDNACRWDIYFDFISDKTIIKGQYSNINWASYIAGEYSSISGTIIKFEVFDDVSYNTVGNYLVRVGIEDAAGRKRYQCIIIHVVAGGC